MPWSSLRRRAHVEVMFDEVAKRAGGSLYVRSGARALILIAPGLDFAHERCALAHELVHDDLGVVCPPATPELMQRVEAMTRQRTAEWLVPLDELLDLVTSAAEFEPVTAELVAEEFDVTVDVAAEALNRLAAVTPLEQAG